MRRWAMGNASDPFDLDRFVQAQRGDYERALAEIRAGRKRSHWMWYAFPQYDGLGSSATSQRYATRSVAEAEAYLRHSSSVLGRSLMRWPRGSMRIGHRVASLLS
jgi:uncharacterized protein (DUF1810 family)